jgi:AAHS family benzoate transporter-like MFS transporter
VIAVLAVSLINQRRSAQHDHAMADPLVTEAA